MLRRLEEVVVYHCLCILSVKYAHIAPTPDPNAICHSSSYTPWWRSKEGSNPVTAKDFGGRRGGVGCREG